MRQRQQWVKRLGALSGAAALLAAAQPAAAQSAVARSPRERAALAAASDKPAYSAQAREPAPVGSDEPLREWDPIEPVNRAFFKFNDALDVYVLEPTARGWRAVTPQGLRNSVSRFFVNVLFPLRFAGCLAQGRPLDSASELLRFGLNTTVGLAGFFDPASRIGLELHEEDLGQALGRWGIGPGPYLMLPVLGPNSLRDLIDIPLGSAASLVPGLNIVNVVNTRAGLIVEVREAKAASLDYYSFVRNAYLQRRRSGVRNETESPQETDDELYEFSDDGN
jgi:phospholipid-binding lipoprotein MlaA